MPKSITQRVAARIVELRRRRGMTQDDVAAKAGIHRISLVRIERGVKKPTLETLDKIARALRVTLVDLVK